MNTKQKLVSGFRRGEILNAARKVFARKGFANGIVDDIAAEAGLAKGTIYLYFSSKKDIYQALLQHDMEAVSAGTLKQVDAAFGLKDKIRAFILVRLQNAELNRQFFLIMDNQPAGLAFTRSQYRDWLKGPVLHLAAAIEDAQRRGEIRPVPSEKIAWVVADLIRGAILRRLVGQTSTALIEEVPFLVDLIWAALEPQAGSVVPRVAKKKK